MQQTDSTLSFVELRADPGKYQGKTLVLGGEVMKVQLQDGKSLLWVSQKELDSRLRPVDAPIVGGTFLVESEDWLSPDTYVPKRKVTVAGVVLGQRDGFPLLRARQIYLWEYPYKMDDLLKEWIDPSMSYWYTPPYFDPWRTTGGRGQ
jgi:starvation-inducible outer membrane lipoprotein